MRIDEATERRIKEAADIVDVVSDFVTLKKAGAEYTGLCPFHEDRHTGSFMVSPRKNIAHCFPCAETWNPVDFVMKIENLDYPDALRWLAQKYGIFIADTPKFQNIRPSKPRPPHPPEPPKRKRTWPLAWAKKYLADDTDTFVRWLYTLPWNDEQRARLPKVLAFYGVGHSHFEEQQRDGSRRVHDFTIFWQIDDHAVLHNGHMMKYREDGHRVKDKDAYAQTWIHARMKRAKIDPFDEDKDEASYCLFGQHLMLKCPDATINIVESEKTAIIMATAYGGARDNLWMACFGLGNLTNANRLLQPLIDQRKRIVLYPDHDGIDRWQKAAKEINYERLQVNTDPVLKWWRPEDGEKADVADVVLRIMSHVDVRAEATVPPQQKRFDKMIRENPAVGLLAEQLNLQPE